MSEQQHKLCFDPSCKFNCMQKMKNANAKKSITVTTTRIPNPAPIVTPTPTPTDVNNNNINTQNDHSKKDVPIVDNNNNNTESLAANTDSSTQQKPKVENDVANNNNNTAPLQGQEIAQFVPSNLGFYDDPDEEDVEEEFEKFVADEFRNLQLNPTIEPFIPNQNYNTPNYPSPMFQCVICGNWYPGTFIDEHWYYCQYSYIQQQQQHQNPAQYYAPGNYQYYQAPGGEYINDYSGYNQGQGYKPYTTTPPPPVDNNYKNKSNKYNNNDTRDNNLSSSTEDEYQIEFSKMIDEEQRDEWFPEHAACECCKGYIYNCSDQTCLSLGYCGCSYVD